MSHTPGPWNIERGNMTIIVDGNRRSIAQPLWPMNQTPERFQGTYDANASLIAAAPDLLEALEDLLARGAIWAKDEHIARAAIAKAKA